MNSLLKGINTIQINTTQISNTFCRSYAKLTPFQKLIKDEEKKLSVYKNVISIGLFKEYHKDLFESVDQELLKGSHQLPKTGYVIKTSFESREKATEFFKQAKDFTKKLSDQLKEKKKIQIEKEKKIEKEIDTEEENKDEPKIEPLLNASESRFSVNILLKTLEPVYKVTKEYIESLPRSNIDTGNAIIVDKVEEIENGVKLLLNGKSVDQITLDDGIVLGFDVEWAALEKYTTKTKKDPKVALVTLTNGSDTVLFRVCHTGLDENSELGKLLKSDIITKTGFGSGKDANKIAKDFGFTMDGVFDLKYSPKIRSAFQNRGIEYVVAGFFEVNIKRMSSLVLSGWATSQELKPNQIHSSALYTIYSLKTYFILPSLKVDTTFIDKKDPSLFLRKVF
ncbi:hypothetical protein ACTFIV_004596 [Dictyostelium citrinum]